MSLVIADRVKETSITEGVGALTLSGATFGGFQTFQDAIGDGNTTYYCIENGNNFEIGIGTFTNSSNSLSRDTVLQSSNSDNKINIVGVSNVFCVIPAERLLFADEDNSAILETPLVFKRSDDGDYWQAFSTDYTTRVLSLFIEEGLDPVWKLGLKTSRTTTTAPYYGYVSAKDGFVELKGNNLVSLSIDQGASEGLTFNHRLEEVLSLTANAGAISVGTLIINSDDTTTISNNSISEDVLSIEGGAGHISNLQTWNVATDEKASINQYGDFQSVGDITAPSGKFHTIRFADTTIQTTAALPFASGALIEQNAADIITQSGYFQSAIDSIDSTAVSGWAESYIDQTSGILQSQIDINESNISSVSGLIGDADFLPGASGYLIDQNAQDILAVSGLLYDDSSISGYFESRVDQADIDIATVSGLLYDDTAISGYFESRVDSADSNITSNSGYFESRADSADLAVDTVSGLLTPSGESFDFTGNILTYNNSYGGSFTADLSSLSTFDTSGVRLDYSAGTLTYTNNAGGSFDVDLSSISGDVYAMIVDGAPTTLDTLNEIAAALNDDANIANTLISLISTTSGNLQSQIDSNDTDIATLFTASGNLQSQIDSNDTDIATVSGLLYDDAAISGYFESRVDQADADIATVSGLLYDDTAISGYFESRSDLSDLLIVAHSGYFESRVDLSDANITTLFAASGNLQSQIDSNDTDIATVSGLLYDDTAISGYFESRVDQADADILTVSGLLGSAGGSSTGVPSGIGFFDDSGSISGNNTFIYDGVDVALSGNIVASGKRVITSDEIYHIKQLTQAEYDALTPDPATFYIITDSSVEGPIQYPIRTVYSDTAIQLTDYSLLAGSGLNFTLPTSVGNRGTAFNVKNISTGTVVVSGIGSQTIDGQTSVEISTQYQSMTFQSDNSNWVIV